MTDVRLDVGIHLLQVALLALVGWHLVHVNRKNAIGVRERFEDVSGRAQANIEIEAQEVRVQVQAAETAVRETAEVTDSKIEALSEKLEEK